MDQRIVIIETSGRQGCIALAQADRIVAQERLAARQEHARDLFPMLDKMCREKSWRPDEIGQCFISIGPGSFTGLRIAVAFARHLALAVRAKICAVPTLDVLARNALDIDPPPPHVAVILDAKRNEVFAALFDHKNEGYLRTIDPVMISLSSLLENAPRPLVVLGEAVEKNRTIIEGLGATPLNVEYSFAQPQHILTLGRRMAAAGLFTPPRELIPLYVRRPEAEELWEKRIAKKS